MSEKPTYDALAQLVRKLQQQIDSSHRKQEEVEKIINYSLDMIGSGNLEGYFTRINSCFRKILGYTEKEMLASPFVSFVHDEDAEKTKKALAEAAGGRKAIFIQNRYKCKDGSFKWIEWKVRSFKDENLFIAVGREITHRKLSEERISILSKAVEASSDAIGMSTAEGRHFYQNVAFDNLFGDIGSDPPRTLYVDEKIGRKVFETIMSGASWDGEVEMYGKDGAIRNILLRAYPIKDKKGNVRHLVGIHTNITHRLKLEETLRKERDRAQNYLDIAGGIIVMVNSDQTVSLINKKGCEILGYDEKEIIGQNWIEKFIPHRHASKVKDILQKLMEGEMAPVEHADNLIVTKSGEERFISWHNAILKDKNGNITATLSSGLDITERRNAEEALQRAHDELEVKVLDRTKKLVKANKELQLEIEERKKVERQLMQSREQLRELSQYLQSSRERERTRIAREVHDDLGQVLTAIKMDVSWLAKKMNRSQLPLIEKAGSTKKLVDQAIKTVKKITSELRPGLLDDLGLVAAIEWYAEDFEKRSQIELELIIDPPEMNLLADFSTTIFRIFQEALTNVARHSKATKASVILSKSNNVVELVVEDNGMGFSEKKIADRNSFGLLGIKERVHSLGGQVSITCDPGKGTKVEIAIPAIQFTV